MSDLKIRLQNLSKSFGNHEVLKDINLDIKKSKSHTILGGSGSGKSVLIKTIIGLIKPTSGIIEIDSENMLNFSSKNHEKFIRKCGFLFQSGALFDSLNVMDNITFYAKRIFQLNKKQAEELAILKLNNVGLTERILYLFPNELSGGMQKRVSLARTIAADPEIIFFDEPTTGLDPIMSNVINDLIIKIHKETKATCITITHDMNTAYRISDEISMIYDGKIIWTGSSKDIKKTDNEFVKQFVNGEVEGPILI